MEGRIYQHVGFGDLGMRSKGTQVDFHPSFFNVHRGDGDKTFTRGAEKTLNYVKRAWQIIKRKTHG